MKKETVCVVMGKTGSDVVKLKDLEKVKCKCGGKLKIAGKGEQDYGKVKTWRLQCQKRSCRGSYFARTALPEEVKP